MGDAGDGKGQSIVSTAGAALPDNDADAGAHEGSAQEGGYQRMIAQIRQQEGKTLPDAVAERNTGGGQDGCPNEFFAEVAEGKQIAGHVQYRCDQSGGEAQPVFCQKHQPDDASLCDIYPLMNIVNAEGIDGRAGHDEKHMLYRQSFGYFFEKFCDSCFHMVDSFVRRYHKGYSNYKVKEIFMKDYFSIGELADFQQISKQTLIYYDKIGLFQPAYVDPQTGYRYYSASQIDYLDTILIMKKIGFSLKEIQEHMHHFNVDKSLAAFRHQLSVIDAKIQELNMIRSRVAHRCEQIEQAKEYTGHGEEVTVERVQEQFLLYRDVEEPCSMREISIATKECFAQASRESVPIYFQCGVVVPLQRIQKGKFTEASRAFVVTEPSDCTENIERLPAGLCASICHEGDYASIGASYRKLQESCRRQSLEIISDAYEFCINDYLTSGNEKEYLTRIVFYVRPSDQ